MISAIYKRNTIIGALVVAGLYILFSRLEILQKIPGFHCESFGCIGLGIIHFIISFIIIPLFFVGACFFFGRKERKLKAAGFSLLAILISMVLSHQILQQLNQRQIDMDTAAAEKIEAVIK